MTDEPTLSEVNRNVLEIRELLLGNGQPGIITRLAKVEAYQDEHEEGGKRSAINLGGLSAVIAAIVAGIVAGLGGPKAQ